MKKGKVLLGVLAIVALIAFGIYLVWPRNHLEVQLKQSERSPDGNWLGVVQLEVFNTAWVINDPIYAVRLKGKMQKDSAGDLVMYVPVNYPIPEPSVSWQNGTLIITLAQNQSYQALKESVDGVPVILQRRAETGAGDKSEP